MMADTNGIFSEMAGFSPSLNFVRGVFKLTFSGLHFMDEYPGINKYSLKVLDGSSIYIAISILPFSVSMYCVMRLV
jgi:hypothetical protein